MGRPKPLQLHTRHLRTYCAALRINAPVGCQRGTHTNGTAYSLPTYEVATSLAALRNREYTHKHITNTLQSSQTEAQTHTQSCILPASVASEEPHHRLRSLLAPAAVRDIEEHSRASASPCPSATARGRSPASCTRRRLAGAGAYIVRGEKLPHYPRRQQCPCVDAALCEAEINVRPRAGRGVAEADEGAAPPDFLHVSYLIL